MKRTHTKVRVFVSSTFKDMHAERDHLVTVVFPSLRERLEPLGLELYDVDLRWGVPSLGVDGEKANSWEYCRKWIDRVEPFFVCILGQRYGFVPSAGDIRAAEDRVAFDGISITEMEVRHAVLSGRQSKQSSFYFRHPVVPEDVPAAIRETFVDSADQGRLEALKEEIRTFAAKTRRPVRQYPCRWIDSGFADLDEFGRMVLEDLWSGVLRDQRYIGKDIWEEVLGHSPEGDPLYSDHTTPLPRDLASQLVALAKPLPVDPLDAEAEQMAKFAEIRLQFFQGRGQELEKLVAFVRADSSDGRRLCAVTAAPGLGKSALMARLASVLLDQSTLLITHFVGATENSADVRLLLERVVNELDRNGIPHPAQEDQLVDLESLRKRLADRLETYDGDRRLVLLVDAVNQLSEGHDLAWLPVRLGPGARIIVSSVADSAMPPESPQARVLKALQARDPDVLRVELSALDEKDVREIIRTYLEERCKELDLDQVDAIVRLKQARTPLYLMVMLRELCTLGGDDTHRRIREVIANLELACPDTVHLFAWVLSGLERAYGTAQVGTWCSYLALGRVGMAGTELRQLLLRAHGEEAARQALRIERGIRVYLQKRGRQWDFYHGELRAAVKLRYELQEQATRLHREIADLFGEQWRMGDHHAISELPYHQTVGAEWEQVETTLSDLTFIEAKCRAGMAFALVGDYQYALASLPDNREELRQRQDRKARTQRWIDDLVAYSRAWTDRRNQIAPGGTGHNVAPEPPTPVAACEYWTDERIEAECRRLAQHSTRCERLGAFSRFVHSQCYPLRDHSMRPGFVVQHALNFEPDGPVCASAKILLASSQHPVIRRKWPAGATYAPLPLLLSTLRGHGANITGTTITPDCRRAVTSSHDGTVRAWDLESGTCLWVLRGHKGQAVNGVVATSPIVSCVSITPDGRLAASGGWDGTVRVWDLARGSCLLVLEGHSRRVYSVAITPDGRRVVSGGEDGSLRVWDALSGKCVSVLDAHDRYNPQIRCLSITADGRRAVCAGTSIRVWDLEREACDFVLEADGHDAGCVSITPDGLRAVSGGRDNAVRIWDLQAGRCLHVLSGHTGHIDGVGITADGRRAVSGSLTSDARRYGEKTTGAADNTLRLWDLDNQTCARVIHGCPGAVSLSLDGSFAVSGTGTDSVQVWNLESGLQPHVAPVSTLRITQDGRRAICGGQDNMLSVWDLDSASRIRVLAGHSGLVDRISTGPNSRWGVSGGEDRTVRVWDLDTGECLHALTGHRHFVTAVGMTPDGARVVSADHDGALRVWDFESGQCIREMQRDKLPVRGIQVTSDGRVAITAAGDVTNTDSRLRVWDLETGDCLGILKTPFSSFSVTPCEDHVVLFYRYATNPLELWSLRSGRCLNRWGAGTLGDNWFVPIFTGASSAISPDGHRILGSSGRNALGVWDVATGELLRELGRFLKPFGALIARDGVHAVSFGDDATLRLWDLTRGECIALCEVGSGIDSIGIHGSHCVTADKAGGLRVYVVQGYQLGSPLTTAARLWRFDRKAWDVELSAACPWCGIRFAARTEWLDRGIECPVEGCGKPLRLNPYACDRSTPTGLTYYRAEADPTPTSARLRDTLSGRTTRATIAVDVPGPHPNADASRASHLNLLHQKALAEWRALPWWRRRLIGKPKPPEGI